MSNNNEKIKEYEDTTVIELKQRRDCISRDEILEVERKERLNYLLNDFFQSEFLLGRIINIKKDDIKYFTFIELVMPNNIKKVYKLDNRKWKVYCNLKYIDKNFSESLKVGDLIYFKPILNKQNMVDNEKKDLIISAMPESVKKVIQYKDFLKEAKINIDEVIIEGNVAVEYDDDIKLWASKEFYKSLAFLHERLIKTLSETSDKLEKVEEEIESKKLSKKSLQDELMKIKNEVESGKMEIENQKKTLEFWGFENDLYKDEEKIEIEYADYTMVGIIDYLRKYLFKYKGLRYTENILRRFFLAIKCNELIILSGPSGTGKTSLVNGFSEAVGGETKIISVKPSWTDTEDLIGFYNPIEQAYISTPFLDAMIEAKNNKNKEKLYLICLDEMNIAHVEYYFAEFLSKLELDKGKKVIQLYSEEIYKEILEEIINIIKLISGENVSKSYEDIKQWCDNNGKIYPDFIMQIRKKVKFIEKYPAEFEIPENIRFIGTMNIDHTTKVISPKVIDRSFILELTQEWKNYYDCDKLIQEELEKICLPLNTFSLTEGEYSREDINSLVNLNDNYLKELLCDFNYRSEKHMINYYKNGDRLEELGSNRLYSDIVYMKILPRVNCIFKNNDEKIEVWNRLYKELKKYTVDDCASKIEKMNKFAVEHKILSFWSVY